MTAHDLAKKLLEMPEDTVVLYHEVGKLSFTKVVDTTTCHTGGEHLDPKAQEFIRKNLPSTYVILNGE